jgi:hypothetical protein
MVAQQLGGIKEQVVKVHRVVHLQQFLVAGVHTLDHLIAVGNHRHLVWTEQLILGIGNGSMHPCRAVGLFVDVQLADRAFDQGFLIV